MKKTMLENYAKPQIVWRNSIYSAFLFLNLEKQQTKKQTVKNKTIMKINHRNKLYLTNAKK